MTSWLGPVLHQRDRPRRTVAFYEALGLDCTSRTEIPQACEAIVEYPGRAGRSCNWPSRRSRPTRRHGQRALEALREHQRHRGHVPGRRSPRAPRWRRCPKRMERWPVTMASCGTATATSSSSSQRHPWPDDAPDGGLARPVLPQRDRHRGDDRVLRAARADVHQPHRHPTRQRGDRRAARPRRQAAARPAGRPGRSDPHGVDVEALREHRRLRRPARPPSTPGTRRSSTRRGSTGGR